MSDERSITLTIENDTNMDLHLENMWMEPDRGKWIAKPPNTLNRGEKATCKSANMHIMHGYCGNFSYSDGSGALFTVSFKKPYDSDKTTVDVEVSITFGAVFTSSDLQHHHSNAAMMFYKPTFVQEITPRNVPRIFDAINDHGTAHTYTGSGLEPIPVVSHSQGFAHYNGYRIITYNNMGQSRGLLNIYNASRKCFIKTYEIPVEHMNHPGGAQVIGDFLAVAVQSSDYETNEIHFFSLKGLNDDKSEHPEMLPAKILLPDDQHCASVGIASLPTGNDRFRYYVMVSGDGSSTLYNSSETQGGLLDKNITFSPVKRFKDISYQGIALVTDVDNNMFMFAFDSVEDGLTFDDYVYLYELHDVSGTNPSISEYGKRHIYTTGGGVGILKPHCRYGTGIRITSEDTIKLFVTNWQSDLVLVFDTFTNPTTR